MFTHRPSLQSQHLPAEMIDISLCISQRLYNILENVKWIFFTAMKKDEFLAVPLYMMMPHHALHTDWKPLLTSCFSMINFQETIQPFRCLSSWCNSGTDLSGKCRGRPLRLYVWYDLDQQYPRMVWRPCRGERFYDRCEFFDIFLLACLNRGHVISTIIFVRCLQRLALLILGVYSKSKLSK